MHLDTRSCRSVGAGLLGRSLGGGPLRLRLLSKVIDKLLARDLAGSATVQGWRQQLQSLRGKARDHLPFGMWSSDKLAPPCWDTAPYVFNLSRAFNGHGWIQGVVELVHVEQQAGVADAEQIAGLVAKMARHRRP